MSILFVLLTFLIIIAINYSFHTPDHVQDRAQLPSRQPATAAALESGFAIPQDYSFHPGHTWVFKEDRDGARVGVDKFAADLIGKIDRIEIAEPGRWVRQGQRLMTLHSGEVAIDIFSPVEGVVLEVNSDVIKDPMLTVADPYKNGWIAKLRSPDLLTNEKNLFKGPMVAPWMRYSANSLKSALASANPALAQDGGVPVSQVLLQVEPELRRKLIKEFFLN